jgi:ribosomal protein S18 acetylase RimI-like enzyme
VSLIAVTEAEKNDFLKVAERHFRELNPSFTPATDWETHYFATILSSPMYSLRWIAVDGRCAGFVLFGVEKHRFLPRQTGAIYELYIFPQLRRQGIARACALKVIEELRKSSPSKIQLEVTEGNIRASKFWQSLGFRKVTERFVFEGGVE